MLFALLAASAAFVPALFEVACSTDNGDTSHGPHFGDLPGRDANLPDGKIFSPDGSIIDDPDAGDERDLPCSERTAPPGTIAIIAGNDDSLQGAVLTPGSTWKATPLTGGAAKSKPAIIPFQRGFLAVTHGTSDALQGTRFGNCWATTSPFGVGGVKGAPALALVGAKAHVLYSATDNYRFAHGIHDGTGWTSASDDIGSFGTGSGALAAVGSELVFAENGGNQKLYVRSFTSSWSGSTEVSNAETVGNHPATPELAAVDGAIDLVMVYVEKTTRLLSFATRSAASKAWSDRNNIQAGVTTTEKLSFARIGPSTVMVVFRGLDDRGYYMKGTVSGETVTWTTSAPIGGADVVDVDSAPAVAPGTGADDAIVAYATSGAVSVLRLDGSTWTGPEAVPSLGGSRVAIATK